MADPKVENLSQKERAYLEHLQQAQKLGVNFAQYCRQKGLARKPWYWVCTAVGKLERMRRLQTELEPTNRCWIDRKLFL